MGSVSDICIRLAQLSDHDQLVRMHEALWQKASAEEHARELNLILEGKPVVTTPLIILVAEVSDGVLGGFLEVDLRSHADGCNPLRPVGYIEGWYVADNHRHKGIGRKLLAAAEDWARDQGCVEVASDTWVDNEVSQRVHEALGYEVVDRCVTTVKRCDRCPWTPAFSSKMQNDTARQHDVVLKPSTSADVVIGLCRIEIPHFTP
jgi:aminoglycoside 6'-N-acetyltransferase I